MKLNVSVTEHLYCLCREGQFEFQLNAGKMFNEDHVSVIGPDGTVDVAAARHCWSQHRQIVASLRAVF